MAAPRPLLAVTGSTGSLGGRVAARLASLGQSQRLIVRNPARAPRLPGADVVQASYQDGPAMEAALQGIETLFFVPGNAADRLEQHFSAIDAAIAAGVERIVYLSFLAVAPHATFTHAREHHRTEQHVRAGGTRYTFIRPTFYLDSVPHWFSAEGIIQGPAGNGTIAWVSRDDIADVTATVLTTDGHDGASYDLTSSHALTLAETAEIVAEVTGRPASYHPETLEEARASRARFNPSEWDLQAWVSTYVAIATGELSVVSHTVQALTGHAPQTLAEYLRRNRESWRHLVEPESTPSA
jgi:NAD(P)H dehydrogenase (quinone)